MLPVGSLTTFRFVTRPWLPGFSTRSSFLMGKASSAFLPPPRPSRFDPADAPAVHRVPAATDRR